MAAQKGECLANTMISGRCGNLHSLGLESQRWSGTSTDEAEGSKQYEKWSVSPGARRLTIVRISTLA